MFSTLDYLVSLAGGGGGGAYGYVGDSGAGGGAGGYRTSFPGGTEVTALYYSGSGIPVTVGAGGAGGSGTPGSRGTNGNPSIFSSITSQVVEAVVDTLVLIQEIPVDQVVDKGEDFVVLLLEMLEQEYQVKELKEEIIVLIQVELEEVEVLVQLEEMVQYQEMHQVVVMVEQVI
jgi:hypothetical protein